MQTSPVDLEANYHVVPIRTLAMMNEVQTHESSDQSAVFAYNVLLACMRSLIQHNVCADDPFDQNRWDHMISELHVGIIPKTQTLGATSIAQGLAQRIFDGINCHVKWPVVFAECGSDGMKFQVFAKRKPLQNDVDEIVYMAYEFETAKDAVSAPNPNRIQLGPWRPKGGVDESLVHVIQARTAIRHVCTELKSRGLWNDQKVLTIRTFITEDASEFYEAKETTDEMRSAMRSAANEFFLCSSILDQVMLVPWDRNCYFMSHDDKTRLEGLGCKSMYENLKMVDLLPPDIEIVESWGIERRSTQIGGFNIPNYVPDFGRNNTEPLTPTEIGERYTSELRAGLAKHFYVAFSRSVFDTNSDDYKCVIALRSEFAVLLSDKRQTQLREALRLRIEYDKMHPAPIRVLLRAILQDEMSRRLSNANDDDDDDVLSLVSNQNDVDSDEAVTISRHEMKPRVLVTKVPELVYKGESGALNEDGASIFATLFQDVDHTPGPVTSLNPKRTATSYEAFFFPQDEPSSDADEEGDQVPSCGYCHVLDCFNFVSCDLHWQENLYFLN